MEWVLQSPQIHSTFGNLGFPHADGYHINENCNAALESILHNILTEDKYLRSYRRNISFGQNIKKDLIPLLIHAKDDKTIELLIRILVHLTIPIECLLSVDVISKGEFGRHTVFELNNLLASTKTAFTDHRVTRVIIEFLKKNAHVDQKGKLSHEQCTNISNSLWLLRNILHIPEEISCQSPNYNGSAHTVQNQILWNIFSQSIDKVLIKLMTNPDACNWGVTMVQLIALLYKDQHVVTLHKLLNLWLEASISDSSEDNESNTSPPDRAGSEDSSPMLTSDPTSDSSDNGGSGKNSDEPNNGDKGWETCAPTGNNNGNKGWETCAPTGNNNGNKGWMTCAPTGNNNDNKGWETCAPTGNNNGNKGWETCAPTGNNNGNKGWETCALTGNNNDNKGWETCAPTGNNNGNKGWETCAPTGNNNGNKGWETCALTGNNNVQNDQTFQQHTNIDTKINNENHVFNKEMDQSCPSDNSDRSGPNQTVNEKKPVISETSDCGYETQIKNQESISTSSNEDDVPTKKPVHQKPHNPKQRINNKVRSGPTLQDRKRKKIVKRGKSNIINVEGLSHKTPTDDDISNVLKEFTVDFLLKGYNSLVQSLHSEILTNMQLKIDTSHFFWLVTYFLKFATQIELDLEHVCSVLSYDIVSYLTAEGVNLCEQFELAIKLDGNDLTPTIRRLHLVVTAIREFVQAIEVYKKFTHLNKDDHDFLINLQIKMSETEELRSLMVLLLRHYNPKYHSKQYLQDLVVTNHILLMFLDSVMKLPDYNCSTDMVDHIRQFATSEIMYQYGLLLEDYSSNGEFVNDCIFTVMHHVGGDLASLITLFQPKILQTFTSIWKSEFEICDDWSDLIEYVINTFIKKPHSLHSTAKIGLDTESLNDDKLFSTHVPPTAFDELDINIADVMKKCGNSDVSNTSKQRWTEDELSSLSWTYMQCSALPDVIGEMMKLLKEDGVIKSRDSVVRELLKQNIINKDEFENLMKGESDRNVKSLQVNKEMRDDEIGKLCEQLTQDGKSKFLDWVQKVLLETCYAKLYFEKKSSLKESADVESKLLNFELFKKKACTLPVMSPVSYHSLLSNQSVPLVPWNCQQAGICKDLKFLQLLHKLGFHMPVDSGKVFIRIPHFWTADFLYDVAGKILPIDTNKLKFSIDELSECSIAKIKSQDILRMGPDLDKDLTVIDAPENFYQIHKQKHLATMVNFTPMPGTSFSSEVEIDKQNWLKVVQKSQEYKITLNLESIADQDQLQQQQGGDRLRDTEQPQARAEPGVGDPEYYNNSVCETASVASDLTRMYVSDEDEKPEIMVCARVANDLVLADGVLDDHEQEHHHEREHDRDRDRDGSCDSDDIINTASKRPRFFSPTF